MFYSQMSEMSSANHLLTKMIYCTSIQTEKGSQISKIQQITICSDNVPFCIEETGTKQKPSGLAGDA
jgi:hypothetical protein